MQKIKLTAIFLFAYSLIRLFMPSMAYATPLVYIQQLPSYINVNSFNLSCTSNGTSAQFYVSKNGGVQTSFGPAINLSTTQCLVPVTSSEVNDQTNYTFTVTVDGVSSSTSTFFDNSGPSGVSGYYKERVNDGKYKLHWRNPGDSDFDKVVIYRGESADFSADNGHEIARVSGGSNSDMTYDDNFSPDANKTYFYAIRALDHAGNSSSLVGDGGTTTTSATPKAGVLGASTKSAGKVTSLPKEGSVLGTEASPTATPVSAPDQTEQSGNVGATNWVMTHKKISLAILLILIAIGYGFYQFSKKNK